MCAIPWVICIVLFILLIKFHISRKSERTIVNQKLNSIEFDAINKIAKTIKENKDKIAKLTADHQNELDNLRILTEQRIQKETEQKIREERENIQVEKNELLSLSEKEIMVNCLLALSTYAQRIDRVENELAYLSISINELEKIKETETIPYIQNRDITSNDLIQIAHNAAKRFERIKDVAIKDAVIYGTVISQHKASTWSFSINFNDHGELTGNYKILSENTDSTIPERFAKEISKEILYHINSK